MAFHSWLCAISNEPIPSGYLDSEHGHITVLLGNSRTLSGLHTGYGTLINPQAFDYQIDGRKTELDELPGSWFDKSNEVSIYRAWISECCDTDYESLENNNANPQKLVLDQAVVFKNKHWDAHKPDPSALTAAGPCPYDGIFYGTMALWQQPYHSQSTAHLNNQDQSRNLETEIRPNNVSAGPEL